jgi:hypothetical protein
MAFKTPVGSTALTPLDEWKAWTGKRRMTKAQ